MGLLLTTDSEDELLAKACELWLRVHEGDHFPETESARADVWSIKRKLEGKYTKLEREEIAQAAIALLD